jgi:hypothetical protein
MSNEWCRAIPKYQPSFANIPHTGQDRSFIVAFLSILWRQKIDRRPEVESV